VIQPGRLARLVLQVDDSPTRVALAFSIGIFIAFFPVLGTHTALALALSFAFRLNRVAILAGSLMNNPWTVGPMFTAGTLVGCALLGVSPASLRAVSWELGGRAFLASILHGFRPLLWPFLVGNLTIGVVAAAASFFTLRAVLRSRRSRKTVRPEGAA
jgi:hypothetical protein